MGSNCEEVFNTQGDFYEHDGILIMANREDDGSISVTFDVVADDGYMHEQVTIPFKNIVEAVERL